MLADSIASVLNELAGQGRLRHRRKGKQRVLWSLISKEIAGKEESRETGDLNRSPSRVEEPKANRFKSNKYKWLIC